MLIVMVISIIFFIFIRVDSPILRVVYRVALVPVIAGVSYEFIRFAGNTNNLLIRILSIPGMWLQALTTKEPDDDMIEVAIAAVEAVFDWRAYQGRSEENPLEAEVFVEEEAKEIEAKETEGQTQEETETAKEEAAEPALEKEPEQTKEPAEDNESAEETASDKDADELQDIEDILEAKE